MALILGEAKELKIEKVTELPSDSNEYRIVGYDGELYFQDTSSYKKTIKENGSPYFTNVNAYGNIVVTGTVDGRDIASDGTDIDYLISISGEASSDVTAHAAVTGSEVHGLGTASIHNFDDFQEPLSSGVNIKTINSQSIVGSGNLIVTGEAETYNHSELTNLAFADAGHTGFEQEGAAVAVSGTLADALTAHAAVTGSGVHGLGTASIHNFADFQEPLVSGTNIKTINGLSVLGSGDLNVSGGVQTNLETHIALTGESVHGLGTISGKTFWLGSQATYDGLGSYDGNTIYFIEE